MKRQFPYFSKKPVIKKRIQATKRISTDISSTTIAKDSEGGGNREGIGATRAHLCYHEPAEYEKLKASQKVKLAEWRKKQGLEKYKLPRGIKGGRSEEGGGVRGGGHKATISATVNKKVQ